MYDIYRDIKKWVEAGQTVAVATVINTWGSAPRKAGAKMAVNEAGEMTGSVSGGCVEGAVVEAALETLKTGQPQYLHFGVADETAWEVGLACGGRIEVFVQVLDKTIFNKQAHLFETGETYALLTQTKGPKEHIGAQELFFDGGSVISRLAEEFQLQIKKQARDAYQRGETEVIVEENKPGGSAAYFVDVHLPPPKLVIVGGVHISIALVRIANTLGFETIVVDPRRAFGSETRFQEADQLIQKWPDKALKSIGINRSTAIAILTHDPKLDDPALMVALQSDAFYIGALGSRKTQEKRRKRLLVAGLVEAQLDRLHGPIGLDLGGRSPEEIALSIIAEIVGAKHAV